MASFIHLCDAKQCARIRRGGITLRNAKFRRHKGIFATPVAPNFYYTFQWVRELRRKGVRLFIAIQFKIDDAEEVLFGRYGREPSLVTAAEATELFMHHDDPHGFEVIIPRAISAKEITRTFVPPQVSGWRYYPGFYGHKPCGCPYCQRGQIKSRKIQDEYGST